MPVAQILHRDISWTNVLIDAMHSDKHKHDNFRGRPFIDAVLGVGYIFSAWIMRSQTQVPHREEARHALLSDFDCACIRLPTWIRGEVKLRYVMHRSPRYGLIVSRELLSRALCWFPDALDTLDQIGFQTSVPKGCYRSY
jgi:hypothetical protein